MNYFHMTFDDVMWGTNYLNLGMLAATVPSYETEDDTPEAISDRLNKTKLENHLG